MSRQLSRELISIAVVLGVCSTGLLACGPNFPNRMLVGSNELLLRAPVGDFSAELSQIKLASAPKLKALVPKRSATEQTAEAELVDLTRLLEARKTPADEVMRILKACGMLREKLREHVVKAQKWREERQWRWKDQEPDPKPKLGKVTLPKGLPGEFEDYFRGAIAYHQDRMPEARKAWEALLSRPAKERKFRSTWATFMIGKSYLDSEPKKAAKWFQRTRELARAGFVDSLGLAAASFGWEAKAALNRDQYVRAIHLYLVHRATGDPTAEMSLRTCAVRVLAAGGDTMKQAARGPIVRRVITAYLVSSVDPYQSTGTQVSRKFVKAWYVAIEEASARDVVGADRLAWAAYQAGEMKVAARWLNCARDDAPIAQWLRAKLLLRSGKVQPAVAMLAKAVRALPTDAPEDMAKNLLGWYEPSSPKSIAAGELAVLSLSGREYTHSADLLLRHGWWTDAAYVCERVLTADELIRYIDKHWPEELTVPKGTGKLAKNAKKGFDRVVAMKVRYLLARRLTRIGRWKEARPYYPPNLRPRLDAYVQAIRNGHDPKRIRAQRAASLWEAAGIAREYGMELLGTELEPDWHVYLGSYTQTSLSKGREAAAQGTLMRPSTDEQERTAKHLADPQKRFHYRYIAAGHAWAAAELMPDQSDDTARVLCKAGAWLQNRDPKSADKFYKALVIRCGKTELGRQADELRWFPKLDEKK